MKSMLAPLIIALVPAVAQEYQPNTDYWKLGSAVAARNLKEKVHPLLLQAALDPALPKTLSGRIKGLLAEIERGKIEYLAVPAYIPGNRDKLAHADFNEASGRFRLLVFMPAVGDLLSRLRSEGSPAQMHLWLALAFVHEKIHFELDPKYPIRQRAGWLGKLPPGEEAEAWGITVLEVVHPLIGRGANLPADFLAKSGDLDKLSGNFRHPDWIQVFDRQ